MILKEACKVKIAVVGDVMVDKYQVCAIQGMSPEDELAPKLRPMWVPEIYPGGAANVGQCAHRLGADVEVFGVVGEDEEGVMLRHRYPNLCIDTGRCTTSKLRYVTQKGRQICRIDREEQVKIGEETQNAILEGMELFKPDVIILSDYAKGVLSDPLFIQAINNAYNVPILVDPKGDNFEKYGPVDVITPNAAEFTRARQLRQGSVFIPGCSADVVIETLSQDGASHWTQQIGGVWKIAGGVGAAAREVGDPSGCGDAFIAAMAVCLANKYPLELSLRYAAAAGALTFDHRGVYAPSRDEIEVEVKRSEYRYVKADKNG